MDASQSPSFFAALPELAVQFGTPTYAYDWATLRERATTLRAAFPDAQVRYAIKANPNVNLLERLKSEFEFGFDAVSGGEVHRALYAGTPGPDIVLNGPGKLTADFALAHEVQATLVLDSHDEVHRAARHAPGARVLIRVNPELQVGTHDHLATGNGSAKFGVLLKDVPEVYLKARKVGLNVIGLHVHIGSSIDNPEDFTQAFAKIQNLASSVGPVEVLDIGGGFGLTLDLHALGQKATRLAQAFQAELWIEPGRYLVADAGILLTRIVGLKRTHRPFVICDASMTELLRPMLYGSRHAVLPLRERHAPPSVWDLAGSACEAGDVLARDITLHEPVEGDLLVIAQAGAYGASMASNYLTRLRPAEAVWDGVQWVQWRRRDILSDLLAAELAAAPAVGAHHD
ncbi:diaminopimelate decarboxylase [Deinococcus frigens]|uniref:diaminopimelate decarboxylase n=1 Tax=Deinococcus frigens TaxID=249403 RepID=UPI00068D1160|nr:diaminopimelate decarboxylase [Deinococcus frigens]